MKTLAECRSTAALTELLEAYATAERLALASADEMMMSPAVSPVQFSWLNNFCVAWDAVQRAEDEGYRLALAEFAEYPAADLPAMPAGFVDGSWHNDACPQIHNLELGVGIWLDFADASRREFEGMSRFIVFKCDDTGGVVDEDTLLETDDWSRVETFLAGYRAARA